MGFWWACIFHGGSVMSDKTTKQTLLPPMPDPRSLNSRKHGILSEQVPHWERDAYAVHAQAVRESVGAGNYLEQRLADRAALALWRLDRVARWEAGEIEADQRRFVDRLQSPDPMAGLVQSFGQSEGPVDTRNLRDTLRALSNMTGEAEAVLLNDPETVELVAADRDQLAEAWRLILAGESDALTDEQVQTVGVDLIVALQEQWNVSAERVARVLVGRKPTGAEVQSVVDWDWTPERHELPGLLAEAVKVAGADNWRQWLIKQHYRAIGEAGKLRVVGERLPVLFHQELARATEPDTKRLEKVARYEAHLERVLYRSLGELKALRAEGAGLPPELSTSSNAPTVN